MRASIVMVAVVFCLFLATPYAFANCGSCGSGGGGGSGDGGRGDDPSAGEVNREPVDHSHEVRDIDLDLDQDIDAPDLAEDEGSRPSGSSVDPETGETTTVTQDAQGRTTVKRTGADGSTQSETQRAPRGSGMASGEMKDSKTGRTTRMGRDTSSGETTTFEWGSDGKATMTQNGPPFNPEPSGTITDPKTGQTKTVTGNPDGSRDIVTKDASGTVTDSRQTLPMNGSGNAAGKTTDPNTGQTKMMGRDTKTGATETFEWGPDGQAKMTESGTTPKFNPEPSGTITNPQTGETTTVVGNPDGSREIIKRDGSGVVTDWRGTGPANSSGGASGEITDPKTGQTTMMGRDTKTGATETFKWGPDGQATRSESMGSDSIDR